MQPDRLRRLAGGPEPGWDRDVDARGVDVAQGMEVQRGGMAQDRARLQRPQHGFRIVIQGARRNVVEAEDAPADPPQKTAVLHLLQAVRVDAELRRVAGGEIAELVGGEFAEFRVDAPGHDVGANSRSFRRRTRSGRSFDSSGACKKWVKMAWNLSRHAVGRRYGKLEPDVCPVGDRSGVLRG